MCQSWCKSACDALAWATLGDLHLKSSNHKYLPAAAILGHGLLCCRRQIAATLSPDGFKQHRWLTACVAALTAIGTAEYCSTLLG